MKNIKKRGIWAMWIGLILIICTVVPALAGASVNAIVLQIVGWVLFIVGAIVRGKQKKEQRKLEQALYVWANERVGPDGQAQPQIAPAPARNPLQDRIDELAKENDRLRQRIRSFEATEKPQRKPWEEQAEQRSLDKLAAALEEAREIIRAQAQRIEALEAKNAEPQGAAEPDRAAPAGAPETYIVFDLETTGLYPGVNEIIEIGAIRYFRGVEAATFHTMVKPERPIPERITQLTGIGMQDVENAPSIREALLLFVGALEDCPLIAHNAQFDRAFLLAALPDGTELTGPIYDTLALAKQAFPGLPSYKLEDLKQTLSLGDAPSHRALDDVRATAALFARCVEQIHGLPEPLAVRSDHWKPKYESVDVAAVCPAVAQIDPQHPLYQKGVVFTGTFAHPKQELMQLAANRGALLQERVTLKTGILVVGAQDPQVVGPDGKSAKMRKAERYNAEGRTQISMIDEARFLELAEGERG